MVESQYIHKSHNVSVLVYHIVTPAKFRKKIFEDDEVEEWLKVICLEIQQRYEINFLEIGVDEDHVHFLVQSVPMYRPSKVVQIIKSITAREIFLKFPYLKKKLWG
jgi:REP element-mobilizing transposase RayT